MKEENKVLRKVVEQTMKDYHDLQMKIATIHQSNQEKVKIQFPCLFFFFYNRVSGTWPRLNFRITV